MNSEELEQSLRAEFESYLNDVFSEIKQEISGFQEKLDSEFKQHRARIDEALAELESKALSERELELSFRDTVAEHLRLAKDEGARITATAIAEAEELHGSASQGHDEGPGFADLRDAIAEISSMTSQADILKSLVNHSAEYTPRGAFFIVKNEHLVGWRVFGREDHEEPDVVRELYFSLSEKTTLSEAIHSLAVVEGFGEGFADHDVYLRKLGFENSERTFAIPLVARGRGVAVLYADNGENGGTVNSEALETLVRIAGLTVELLASAPPAGSHPHEFGHSAVSQAPAYVAEQTEIPGEHPSHEASPDFESHEAETQGSGDPQPEAYEWQQPQPVGSGTGSFEDEGDDSEYGSTFEEAEVEPVQTPVSTLEDEAGDGLSFTPAESESTVEDEMGMEHAEPVQTPEPVSEEQSDTGFSFTPSEPAVPVEDEPGMEYAEPIAAHEVHESSSEEFAAEFEPQDDGMSAEERFDAEVEELYDYSDAESSEEFPAVQESESSAPEGGFGYESSEVAEQADDSAFSFSPSGDDEQAAESVPEDAGSFAYSSLTEEAEKAEAAFDASHADETDEVPAATEPIPAVVASEQAVPAEAGSHVRTRLADRNIDLPIEVPEEERQYHNAARRFARLLVSEIRLYNEQKVMEGCEAHDLYARLKEAIDRSREMYEKRVHGQVAERFDYFNYELVNNLAQGDESKLGDSYPGSVV